MKKTVREKRKLKIRAKIGRGQKRPRLSLFRSNKHIYGNLINDARGVTLLSASDKDIGDKKKNKTEKAYEVGKKIAKLALKKGIKTIVFDRDGYLYHGRVKALAEGAREGGLIF